MDLTANQLLLRGLRAVYTDVWQTYDVMGHVCQSPAGLASAFPAEGVDLSSFREESPCASSGGNSPIPPTRT
jgi:hypothetical protein